MEKISVAQARQAEAVGKQVLLQGWVRTRRDSKGGFSFLELNDGSCFGNVQIVADGSPAQLRERDQAAHGRLQRQRRRAWCEASPAKGQATEVQAQQRDGPRLGRPGHLSPAEERRIRSSSCAPSPICGRAPTPSAPSPACATASAARSTSSSRNRASSTSTRRSSPPATAKGPGRCSRSPRSTWASCRATTRARSISARTSSASRTYLTVSGQLEAEIFACALGKVYTFGPTFRAENSNTSRHLAEFWMVEPEMAFFELTDNMDLAEAFLKRIFRDVLDQLRGGHAVLPRAHRQDRRSRRSRRSSPSEFVRLPYTEAVEILQKSGKTFEFPVAVGHATCRPSTSAT